MARFGWKCIAVPGTGSAQGVGIHPLPLPGHLRKVLLGPGPWCPVPVHGCEWRNAHKEDGFDDESLPPCSADAARQLT